ncbi:MAG: protein kinase [Eubacterium sp.]|nr:protein kinase [Eubacterium sp.]
MSHILPSFISNTYGGSELLHVSERTETYKLCAENSSGEAEGPAYLLKVRDISEKDTVDAEERILRKFEELQIEAPRVVMRKDTDEKCFLVRDYIEGQTLQEYAQMRGTFTEEEIIKTGIKILLKLMVFHNLSEPVIHRDIKPKNILITDDDSDVVLIDFDTARVYKEDKSSDTRYLGTIETAAPEQYGFDQSDVRTDIYGVAKTLIYLATGGYDPEELKYYNYSKKFKNLLVLSTSLDKSLRPASAEDMIKKLLAVLAADKRRKALCGIDCFDGRYMEDRPQRMSRSRKIVLSVVCMAIVVGAFVGAFFLGRAVGIGTSDESGVEADAAKPWENLPPLTHTAGEKVDFGESESMKTAVCKALKIDEKDASNLTYADLDPIETLACIGNKSFEDIYSFHFTDNEETLEYYEDSFVRNERAFVEMGDIRSLELIRYMPNLKKLYLVHQKVEDVSFVADCDLSELAIVDCPVSVYGAIGTQRNLSKLVLGDVACDDISFVSKLTLLSYLQLTQINVPTLKNIENMSISELSLDKMTVADESYDVIGRMRFLKTLDLANMSENQIVKIGGSKSIQTLYMMWINLPGGMKSFGEMSSLRNLSMSTVTLPSLDGLVNLEPMYFFPPYVKDLSWIKESPFLQELEITKLNIKDYTVFQDTSIKIIYASEKQKKAIEKQFKKKGLEPTFEVADA